MSKYFVLGLMFFDHKLGLLFTSIAFPVDCADLIIRVKTVDSLNSENRNPTGFLFLKKEKTTMSETFQIVADTHHVIWRHNIVINYNYIIQL